MKRLLLEKLLLWKHSSRRKPIVLDGARQVGKTYLIKKLFGSSAFRSVHTFDFLENPHLKDLFSSSLDPQKIISSLEIEIEKKIDLEKDLIFFDEIGECPKALQSLKYFCDTLPNAFLCASGSNIGLLNSFPVGKVHHLELFPMTFYEFLLASKKTQLIRAFKEQSDSVTAHQKLWKLLLDYFFVSGMPEAVKTWFSAQNPIQKVQEIHKNLLIGYQRYFGKYGGKTNSLHIESVFIQVPLKLQSCP